LVVKCAGGRVAKSNSAGIAASVPCGRPHSKLRATKIHFARINRLQAGQNAAALLFDPGTVDIR
jgi:hypothetical protein